MQVVFKTVSMVPGIYRHSDSTCTDMKAKTTFLTKLGRQIFTSYGPYCDSDILTILY